MLPSGLVWVGRELEGDHLHSFVLEPPYMIIKYHAEVGRFLLAIDSLLEVVSNLEKAVEGLFLTLSVFNNDSG